MATQPPNPQAIIRTTDTLIIIYTLHHYALVTQVVTLDPHGAYNSASNNAGLAHRSLLHVTIALNGRRRAIRFTDDGIGHVEHYEEYVPDAVDVTTGPFVTEAPDTDEVDTPDNAIGPDIIEDPDTDEDDASVVTVVRIVAEVMTTNGDGESHGSEGGVPELEIDEGSESGEEDENMEEVDPASDGLLDTIYGSYST